MVTKAERYFATCAKMLEEDYIKSDGKIYASRDAVIDGYVRMCRKMTDYEIGPAMKVLPDYYVIPDGTARYEIGFTLYIGKAEMGRVSMLYIDGGRLRVEVPGVGLDVDLPGLEEAET